MANCVLVKHHKFDESAKLYLYMLSVVAIRKVCKKNFGGSQKIIKIFFIDIYIYTYIKL